MPRPKIKKRPLSRAPLSSRKNATKAEVARDQRVSIRTIDAWIHDRKIPFRKLSSRLLRFDLDEVQKALDRYTVKEVQ
jgi:excisionase family DNA binding protein